MNKDDILHLTCDCHTHELHFEKDFEDEMWYVSFWQRGYTTDNPWKYRFRCIWQILKTGRPYGDEVILNKSDLEKLQEYINTQLYSKNI